MCHSTILPRDLKASENLINRELVFYTLYYIHCILCIVFHALYSTQCILRNVFYAMYSMQCILCMKLVTDRLKLVTDRLRLVTDRPTNITR